MSTWNRSRETLPREELGALQLKGLRKTLRRLWSNELYRARLLRAGFASPETATSLDDLARLPLSTSADLRGKGPLAHCCADRASLVELHLGGANGPAVAETKADLLATADALARAYAMADLGKGDAFAILEPLTLAGDGLAAYQGCRKAGLFCIPVGETDPAALHGLLGDYRVKDVLATVPSLLRLPSAPRLPSLRVALVPAVGLTDGLRRELETRLGVSVRPLYGLPETGGVGTVGSVCRCGDALHLWEDRFIAEVVDPVSGAALPDGEPGELVLTSLEREAMPLLRFRTGTGARVVSRAACACGRTSLRLEIRPLR